LSTGRQTEQGRAERKDIEIGAVDELLVGECVVRARDKGEKLYVALLTLLYRSPHYYVALLFTHCLVKLCRREEIPSWVVTVLFRIELKFFPSPR
jgi:hypothetical protein